MRRQARRWRRRGQYWFKLQWADGSSEEWVHESNIGSMAAVWDWLYVNILILPAESDETHTAA